MIIKRRDKTNIVGTPLSLQKWGLGFQKDQYEALSECYPEFWEGDVLKNNRKNNVNKSFFNQYVMRFLKAAGIHRALCGAWWCEPPDGIQK